VALIDYQFQIGDLVLGPGTHYIVHTWDGLGIPDIRTDDVAKPLDHGSFYGRDFAAARQVSLSLTVTGTSPANAIDNFEALMLRWTPVTANATTTSPLWVQMPGRTLRYLNGRPRRAKGDPTRIIGNRIPVALEYMAGDPRWYEDAFTERDFYMQPNVSGRGYDRSYDYGYGGIGYSGTVPCTNQGNIATNMLVTFYGPVTNPRLENVTTGEVLDLQLTLATGDILTIDCAARTVILNGTASRYSALRSGSTFFTIPPALPGFASANVRFAAGTFDPASVCTVIFHSAWL
jgi:hypothetical protein